LDFVIFASIISVSSLFSLHLPFFFMYIKLNRNHRKDMRNIYMYIYHMDLLYILSQFKKKNLDHI
jgi:hypothetical protein